MSVHVHAEATLCKVSVLGRKLLPADVEVLMGVLAPAAPLQTTGGAPDIPLEITFYDADALPVELLLALSARRLRAAPLKLVAYHALLAHSLSRLGLTVRQSLRAPDVKPRPGLRALALAGSAQSLDKILAIVARLPRTELSIFVVQHVPEDQPHRLDQLLKTRSDYTVLMPHQLCRVEPGTLYVAPPGFHMRVAHGLVYLTNDARVQFAKPSIDVLLESLAAEYREAVLAVLLCGFGQDGVQGCLHLREAGALVLAEDGNDCGAARPMPDAARDAGACEQVLPLAALVSVLAAALQHEGDQPSGPALDLFLDALHACCAQDYRGYQRDSLERRVRNLMGQLGLKQFSDFQRALFSDVAVFERFSAQLPVGVSSFFRHPAQLRELREQLLPVLQSFPVVKLWSAGCASGEEPYSLALLLEEAGLAERSHLFATDVNQFQLELARSGLYPLSVQTSARQTYQDSGGTGHLDDLLQEADGVLRVAPRLQSRVLFYRHSLADEGIFNEFQLIICRNVLIYFSTELQTQVLQRFAQSLHADGYLVLGPQDGLHALAREQGFVPLSVGSSIFRLKAGP